MASFPQGVSGRPSRPASMHANASQHLSWQHPRARQPVIVQATNEPTSPNSNAHQHCKQRADILYQIIIRQECQTQRLEQQLAQSEAKGQQLTHELLSLKHMIYSGTSQNAHAKLPPIKMPQGDSTWTQGRVPREGSFGGRREDTCAQLPHKQEDNWHQGHQAPAESEQAERGN
ncbi:hypothetical protein TrVFT333_006813 [Trichoderma virens FT-333]|nr:hypothetical protein TrVFT333_006813 [Trichoderma virens FT-333]